MVKIFIGGGLWWSSGLGRQFSHHGKGGPWFEFRTRHFFCSYEEEFNSQLPYAANRGSLHSWRQICWMDGRARSRAHSHMMEMAKQVRSRDRINMRKYLILRSIVQHYQRSFQAKWLAFLHQIGEMKDD